MNGSWILFALLSALFVSIRELYIKKYVKQTPEIIGFATRFFGSLVLLLFCFRNEFTIGNLEVFLVVTGITAILTAITTLIRLKLIRIADISLTTPWLGLVPLFMVFWSAVILKELPGIGSLAGISLSLSRLFYYGFS